MAWDGYILIPERNKMSNTITEEGTSVEFGVDGFRKNAQIYAANKRIIDAAASKYDSLDDAIAALTSAWESFEVQMEEGAKYTPSADLGFGSDNASQIAAAILGRKTSVTAIRKAFALLGK